MDINVRVTLDASDKLAHLIQVLASAVSHSGKPDPASVLRTASELSAVPEPTQKIAPAPAPEPAPEPASSHEPAPESASEPAPKSEPAPEPKLYGVYSVTEFPAPEPDPYSTTAPTPEPAQMAEQSKALTIDDVRRVCLRATKAGKTKVVMDFLYAQGVKNLPALDPALYEALVTVVEDNL